MLTREQIHEEMKAIEFAMDEMERIDDEAGGGTFGEPSEALDNWNRLSDRWYELDAMMKKLPPEYTDGD